MGGAIAQMARLFPHGGYDFGDQVQPLPADGNIPGVPNWRWIHTPGHTPGHVSLFRETEGALPFQALAGTLDDRAQADEEGVREVPPPVPDPHPKRFAAGATMAVAAGAVGVALAWRRGRRR